MSFNEDLCVQYVETLVRNDEVERALLVLDNVPAFYRQAPTPKLVQIREEIQKARYTAATYVNSELDAAVDKESALVIFQSQLRWRLLGEEVKRCNDRGVVPHIVDVGPGTYVLPYGLEALGLDFTYWDVGINAKAQELTKDLPRERPLTDTGLTYYIFAGLEIIEHLPDPSELVVEALRHCFHWPERIHLSTPLFTFDTDHSDWRTAGLPHLRAYTPAEFYNEANRLFPGYQWDLISDRIMSLRGQRKDVVDPIPLPTNGE